MNDTPCIHTHIHTYTHTYIHTQTNPIVRGMLLTCLGLLAHLYPKITEGLSSRLATILMRTLDTEVKSRTNIKRKLVSGAFNALTHFLKVKQFRNYIRKGIIYIKKISYVCAH